MKTGGLKMLQKGPNFKNFRGKNSLLNLRIPAQLGVYAALVSRKQQIQNIAVLLSFSTKYQHNY